MMECTIIPVPVILAHFSYRQRSCNDGVYYHTMVVHVFVILAHFSCRGHVMMECIIIHVSVILAHFSYRQRSCDDGVYYHTCSCNFSPLLQQTEVL